MTSLPPSTEPVAPTIASTEHQGGDFVYRVRPMQSQDLPAVIEIDQVSFTLPWPERAFHYELNENPLSLLWVAEAMAANRTAQDLSQPETGQKNSSQPAPQIVGMIVVWLVIDEAHIATIAVQPAYRRRGIAQQLLATALIGAIQHGMKTATLEVRANNLPAQQLYRRFNFEVAGRRPRYYQDNGEDALLMTLSSMDQNYLSWLVDGGWQHERKTV